MWLKILFASIFMVSFFSQISGEMSACYRDYTKRGCYPGSRHLLPVQLDNRRREIDWRDFEGFLHKLACHCASLAKKRGFKLFGIRFWGECWGGNDVDAFEKVAYREKIPKKHCIAHDYGTCNHKDARECAGTGEGEYIYEIKQRDEQVQDGGFGDWSEWGECSKSCGLGVISRERLCNNPEPYGAKAKDCEHLGAYTQTKMCKLKECPVDGGYADWSTWTTCSLSCGKGVKTKRRQCNSPKPLHGGKSCDHLGAKEVSEYCNTQPCPVDGGFSNWQEWSYCSASCGEGTRERTRKCGNPTPRYNGKSCNGDEYQKVECKLTDCTTLPCHFVKGDGTGGSEELIGSKASIYDCVNACVEKRKSDKSINGVTIPYNTPTNGKVTSCYCEKSMKGPNSSLSWKTCKMDLSKEKVDGRFTKWTDWESCTKTCGGGSTKRTRSCTNPAPRNGGAECKGLTVERKSCNVEKCSEIGCHFAPGDSSGGGEDNIGAKDSVNQCITDCAKKRKTDRTINGVTIPYNTKMDGKVASCYCEKNWKKPGHNNSWKTCKMDLSKEVVDGKFTQWTEWTSCTKTCGGGTSKRTRSCTNPAPKNGGAECKGLAIEVKKCNEEKCSEIGCHFAPGDSSGGGEDNIGKKDSVNQCIIDCAKKRKTDRSINGVTIPYNTKMDGKVASCYCEKNWKKPGHSTSWKTCKMDLSREIVDGKFTQWTEWTSCTKTCDGGASKRSRSCTNPAPKNGGAECKGLAIEVKNCNEEKCSEIGCHFAPGDSSGGGEDNIGKKDSVNQCIIDCAKKRKTDRSINGVTIPYNTKMDGKVESCYCEKNWKKPGHNNSWKTCKMDLSREVVDGEMSDWGKWSACTHTCGKGLRKKQRKCTPPKNGGKACEGPLEYFASCNNIDCSARKCTFHTGDGVGGTEKHIGYFTTIEKCIDACVLKKRSEPSLNGVTYGMNEGRINCYCEYGMTKRNTNTHWKSCILGR